MKHLYLLSLLLAATPAMYASEKMDYASRDMLREFRAGTLDARKAAVIFGETASRGENAVVKALVEVYDGQLPAEAAGYTTFKIAEGFYTVDIPVSELEEFAELPQVCTMSFAGIAEPTMDLARPSGTVSSVQTGLGLGATLLETKPYKGTGVITAIYDTGFDPSHINWLTEDGSENRLAYYLRTTNGNMVEYYGENAVEAPSDNAGQTHATHVAGIMAGAYNGEGTFYGSKETNQGKVPLYGCAPASEMAIAAGNLGTNYILEGVRKLINFAKQQEKPIAVNLSLGNNNGPHDGTSSDVKALDAIISETGAIICISAGNEGDVYCHAGTTFTDEKKSWTVLFANNAVPGGYEVWSSNNVPVTTSIVLVNPSTGSIEAKISSQPATVVTVGNGSDDASALFKENYSGTIILQAGLQGSNNRYLVQVKGNNVKATAANVNGSGAPKYLIGLMMEGQPDQRCDAYCVDSEYSFGTTTLPGIDNPNMNGSISNMATGYNTIVVGAYTTRNEWYNYAGYGPISYTAGAALNYLCSFSSWGELLDGRKLPDITAPGMAIASSYSSYYVDGGYASPNSLCATVEKGDKTYYWAMEQGTSMSCPFVTGVMGLWLQMDPNLKPAKAKEILMETASKKNVTDEIAWGAGKVDAMKGIKEVKKQAESGIDNIIAGNEADNFMLTIENGAISIFATGAGSVTAELYTVSGAQAVAVKANGDTAVLATDALTPGVYVLRATTDTGHTITRKLSLL